jgi:hypothetical protein
MQTTHFWNKFDLHRTKVIILILICCAFQATAQKRKPGVTLHRVDSDNKSVKYGFFLGGHQSYYGLRYSDAFDSPAYEDVSSITPNPKLGFNLGFMLNLRLADQFSVRVVPVKIGLYQHEVQYNFTDGTVDTQLIESTRLEPGIFLKYRSIRRTNSRMYLVAGVSASIRAGKDDLDTTIDRLEVGKTNFKFEFGIGLERYFEFFKFAPELRYARGLNNVITEANNFYHNGINQLITHSFSIYLHFSD